jgi:hypothetical protein
MKIKKLANDKFAVVFWTFSGRMCVGSTSRNYDAYYHAYPDSAQFDTYEKAEKAMQEYLAFNMR